MGSPRRPRWWVGAALAGLAVALVSAILLSPGLSAADPAGESSATSCGTAPWQVFIPLVFNGPAGSPPATGSPAAPPCSTPTATSTATASAGSTSTPTATGTPAPTGTSTATATAAVATASPTATATGGGSCAPTGGGSYCLTDLGTLAGTATVASAPMSVAYGINASGAVVGQSTTADGQSHAFLWQNGTMTDLGTLGGVQSLARAINATGQIVGEASNADGQSHAFLWQNGTMTDLGTLGGFASVAYAINSMGQAAGNWQPSASAYANAFYYAPPMSNLGALNGLAAYGTGINDSGQITGDTLSTGSSGRTHAYVRQSNGTVVALTDLSGAVSYANAIDPAGNVVGSSFTNTATYDAVIWQVGNGTWTVVDLGTLGNTFAEALAINSSGVVVGDGITANGDTHAFRWQGACAPTCPALQDLNTLVDPSLGWDLQFANGVSDSGQIVGSGTVGGQIHAYLLTPAGAPLRPAGKRAA